MRRPCARLCVSCCVALHTASSAVSTATAFVAVQPHRSHHHRRAAVSSARHSTTDRASSPGAEVPPVAAAAASAAAGFDASAAAGKGQEQQAEEQEAEGEQEFGADGWYHPSIDTSLLASPPVNPETKGGVYTPRYDVSLELLASIETLAKQRGQAAASAQRSGASGTGRILDTSEDTDELWESMRAEAREAADREPMLVSFIHSTILNQKSLEAALAFHMANKLAGPSMIATQLQGLFLEYLRASPDYRRSVRRDIMAVRERDPACTSYHDALLYFKGFQALQTHRVAHWLYNGGRHTLAKYLQSQVNQHFQIDIHPAAKFGEGVFIDHGTGIVVGETATVGNDCSILHQVTLGGSGTGTGDRHPKVGNNVLIGAGACLLGDIHIGNAAQIGACSLVLEDVPEGCVAVGVPAKVIGKSKSKDPAGAMQQDFYAQVWGGMDI